MSCAFRPPTLSPQLSFVIYLIFPVRKNIGSSHRSTSQPPLHIFRMFWQWLSRGFRYSYLKRLMHEMDFETSYCCKWQSLRFLCLNLDMNESDGLDDKEMCMEVWERIQTKDGIIEWAKSVMATRRKLKTEEAREVGGTEGWRDSMIGTIGW